GSLAFTREPIEDTADSVLAAAKMAHEFGHIDHAATSNAHDYQLRDELLDIYSSQFKSNGYDINDPVLIELAGRLGGDPDEIHGQREFWAETYSLRYLLEKLGTGERRLLLRIVRKTLDSADAYSYSLPSRTRWENLTSADCVSTPNGCGQLFSASR